jgi:membrane protease YdiL (CAAX protease family)
MSSPENSGKEFELACEGCGEKNPPHFAICWNCGRSLENAQKVEPIDEPDLEDDAVEATTATENPFGRWTGWCELTAVLLVTFVYRTLALLQHGAWSADYTRNSDPAAYLSHLPWYIGLSMLLWILVRRDKAVVQPTVLRKCNWWYEIGFALAILFANLLVVRLVAIFAYQIGVPRSQPQAISVDSSAEWLIYFVVWFFATLYEEILYRVYLQSKIESLIGRPILTILVSSTLFAVSHGYPLRGTILVFATGVLFGSIYYCSRCLPRLALAHWMYDLLLAFLQNH